MARRRLDAEMVRRGIVESREQAKKRIEAYEVLVSGAIAAKPNRQVDASEPIELVGPPPKFVGRAGEKLDHALDEFGIDVAGRRGIDCGASTGGFIDCLLQRGATEVIAIDVGHGQLHERLRADPRVDNRERTNIRDVTPEVTNGPAGIVTADLSFISLASVIKPILNLLATDGDAVVLVKPQFEAGREVVSKGRGIVTDPAVWRSVIEEVAATVQASEAVVVASARSPIKGGEGNVEFLLHLRHDGVPLADPAAIAVEP